MLDNIVERREVVPKGAIVCIALCFARFIRRCISQEEVTERTNNDAVRRVGENTIRGKEKLERELGEDI